MRPRVTPTRVAAIAAVIAAGAMTVFALAGPALAVPGRVVVGGELDGLYPGFTGVMQARVTNEYAETVRVTLLDTTVLDAKSACPASMITVTKSATEFDVAAGATATTPITVHMDFAAPDECQGATWPLHFTASLTSVAGLPDTGMNVRQLLAAGLALLALGGCIAVAARRYRTGGPA